MKSTCPVWACKLPPDHDERHSNGRMSWPRTDKPLTLPALRDLAAARATTAPEGDRACWALIAADITNWLNPTEEETLL